MNVQTSLFSMVFALLFVACQAQPSPEKIAQMSDNIYDYSFTTLEGEEVKMADFKGKKVLIVNTASKCGYTGQYEGLQKLHESHGEDLVIIGFPCNQFGMQEPGSSDDIAAFCEKNYGVSFLMADKIKVKGEDQHPIYTWLTQKSLNGVDDHKIKWNFNKFLIDENGKLVKYFPSGTKPNDDELLGLLSLK